MSTTNIYHDYNNSLTTSLTGVSYTGSLSTASGTGVNLTNNTTSVWNNPAFTVTAATPANQGSITVSGNADFNGEVTIRGVKLDERLNVIEERLGILRPNNDLEGKWEKLKALGEEYRKLEKEILAGEDIWNTLKK